jgi:hypothetical protein
VDAFNHPTSVWSLRIWHIYKSSSDHAVSQLQHGICNFNKGTTTLSRLEIDYFGNSRYATYFNSVPLYFLFLLLYCNIANCPVIYRLSFYILCSALTLSRKLTCPKHLILLSRKIVASFNNAAQMSVARIWPKRD